MSLEKYVTKVLQRFNMQDAKLVGSTLLTNKKLSEGQCPKTKMEKAEMNKIPYAGGAVSWHPRWQKVVALSTTKAEYMATVKAGKEVI